MCFLWFNQIVGSYSIHQCVFPHINIYIKTPSIRAISSFRHTLLRLLPALPSAHTLWQFIMKMPPLHFECQKLLLIALANLAHSLCLDVSEHAARPTYFTNTAKKGTKAKREADRERATMYVTYTPH